MDKIFRRKFIEMIGIFASSLMIGEEVAISTDSYEYFTFANKSLFPITEKHDVVILLTGSYLPFRIKKAKEILEEKFAEKIIVSGYETKQKEIKELLEREFSRNKILFESHSENTVDNAYFVYSFYGEMYDSLILVTSQPHQPRAYFLFEKLHPKKYKITPAASAPRIYEDWEFTFHELLKYSLTKQIFGDVKKGDAKKYNYKRVQVKRFLKFF